MIEHTGILIKIAKQLTSDFDLQDDLVQEGYIALLKAEKDFDESKGCKFITLGYKYALTAMRDYLRKLRSDNSRLEMYLEERGDIDSTDPLHVLLDQKNREQVLEAINNLSEKKRIATELYLNTDYNSRKFNNRLKQELIRNIGG